MRSLFVTRVREVQIGNHQPRTLGSQTRTNFGANAAGTARNHNDFIVHGQKPSVSS